MYINGLLGFVLEREKGGGGGGVGVDVIKCAIEVTSHFKNIWS